MGLQGGRCARARGPLKNTFQAYEKLEAFQVAGRVSAFSFPTNASKYTISPRLILDCSIFRRQNCRDALTVPREVRRGIPSLQVALLIPQPSCS